MSYHLTEIPRGVYGEISKIEEELAELKDAETQRCKIMVLCELSDLLGAIEGYLKKHHPDVNFGDIMLMQQITARAFESGSRKNKDDASQPI